MLNDNSVAIDERNPREWPVIGAGTIVAMLSLAAIFVAGTDLRPTAPFVWFDVATVYLLFATPFSWIASRSIQRYLPKSLIIVTSLVLLCLPAMSRVFVEEWVGRRLAIIAWRATLTIGAAIAGLSLAGSLRQDHRDGGLHTLRPFIFFGLLLIAVGVPELYIESRCQRKENQIQELLSQDRTGESLTTARELAAMQPERELTFRGELNKLPQLVKLLSEQVANLEANAHILKRSQIPADQLELARIFAQLGRRQPAIRILQQLAEDHPGRVEVYILLGTIYEYDLDWENAHLFYSLAEHQTSGPNFQRATALKGMAFSARKLGRYDVAEAAYLQLIRDFPTAENDYLLAQFFEDAQQASEARKYARRAMRKSPVQFEDKGETLIRRMKDGQFGCLNLLRNESSR